MKKQHGLKKYKCNFCNFRSDKQFNIIRHEKTSMKMKYLNVINANIQQQGKIN